MNVLQLPAELWVQIAMSDPRTYNALARTCKRINDIFNVEKTRKSFTSEVIVTHEATFQNYDVVYPTLGGMIHAAWYGKDYAVDCGNYVACYAVEGSFSFGKLTQSASNQPSFYKYGTDPNICIYADKGVITRKGGPAIFLKYSHIWDMLCAELYVEKGKINMLRGLWWPNVCVPEIIKINFDNRSDESRILGGYKVVYRRICRDIDTVIHEHGRHSDEISHNRIDWDASRDCISRINARIAILGTDIPSIPENIFQITRAVFEMIRGRS